MFKSPRISLLLLVILLISGCASSSGSEINKQTGMAEFLCPNFKDSMENANRKVWELAQFKASVKSANDAVLEVMSDASVISVTTNPPASDWLVNIVSNGKDFVNYFGSSNPGSSEQLLQIYGRWKANYESLKTYCP